MRQTLATFAVSASLFGLAAAYSQLVANSRYLTLSSTVLRDWADRASFAEDPQVLSEQIRRKALRYDGLIRSTHLEEGMLVNRGVGGQIADQCDSLLFSSLRFVGMLKLGMESEAGNAWRSIELSRGSQGWIRHPRCIDVGTSRDMLLGLLVAMSQEPRGFDRHLHDLIRQVDENGGYFSTGPIYVSYLTPGLARMMAMLAPSSNIAANELPPIVRNGYATHELTLYATNRGYQAHLVALTVWLEMELHARQSGSRGENAGPLVSSLDRLIEPFADLGVQRLRLDWATHQLVQLDPRNLFFRYLRLRAAGALTRQVAAGLARELMQMPQFPDDRLPSNCDRRADYLWQRASKEYGPSSSSCTKIFHGADFLWMAGLLLEGMQSDGLAPAH